MQSCLPSSCFHRCPTETVGRAAKILQYASQSVLCPEHRAFGRTPGLKKPSQSDTSCLQHCRVFFFSKISCAQSLVVCVVACGCVALKRRSSYSAIIHLARRRRAATARPLLTLSAFGGFCWRRPARSTTVYTGPHSCIPP